ncbi:MAG: FAD-binding oxidoreductase, partial [Actinomycetota bacterium]|nr:FAD-binding oxidoreductase [Actinomycetota bacterium]
MLTALERLGAVILDDVCVPIHRLPDPQSGIEKAAISDGAAAGSFGHADGGNLRPTIIFGASDANATHRARACFADISELAL